MILDDIKQKAGLASTELFYWHDTHVEIMMGSKPPCPFTLADRRVTVGRDWLSDKQWAELVACRIHGTVKFYKIGGRLFVKETYATGGVVSFNHVNYTHMPPLQKRTYRNNNNSCLKQK